MSKTFLKTNAIWGQVEQPKISNDKITYYGDYHTFEEIDITKYSDEVLVWHMPEFSKEEWRYGLYGIKYKPSWDYMEEEDVMTIELYKKYIYLQSVSGFTDILCIINNALNYAIKYNRIILFDGINSVYKINFSDYFIINHDKIICDYNKIIKLIKNKTIYPKELYNKLDLILQGKIKFDEVETAPIHTIKYQNIKLIIPNENPNEDIIINSQTGRDTWGVENPINSFKIFNLFSMKPILKTYCQNNYKNLPKPYLSIHIRNTDYQCDYKNIYYENKDQIHQYKTIYIATDDKTSLDFFRQQGLNIYNFTTFPDIISENLHENKEISGDIKIKDLMSDLYIIAMADILLSNSKGGFINLARECFNNKDLMKNKFK